MASKISEWTEFASVGAFIKEFISNPRSIGAAFPSSRKLAMHMASRIPKNFNGTVVELGPGTGPVTAALFEWGIFPNQLIAVERSPKMFELLKQRFPQLTVIQGDAGELVNVLTEHFGHKPQGVEMIVSSLPLRSLPRSTVEAIEQQLELLLGFTGRFIQFTYDLRPGSPNPLKKMIKTESKIIWQNIPPARVEVFKKVES